MQRRDGGSWQTDQVLLPPPCDGRTEFVVGSARDELDGLRIERHKASKEILEAAAPVGRQLFLGPIVGGKSRYLCFDCQQVLWFAPTVNDHVGDHQDPLSEVVRLG